MRTPNPWIPLILALVLGVPAGAKPKPSSLQAQLRKVTAERDDLKERLAATENLQADLAACQKSLGLARQETDTVRRQLDETRSTLAENKGGSDVLLKDLQKAKDESASRLATIQSLRDELTKLKQEKADEAGKLPVPITPDVIPAKAMNLNKVTPKAKKVSGVVVVNVLISENGEVLDTRILQPLPGEGEWVDKAHAACLEAAKRIVFDPARAGAAKTKVRVWQGVGFYLD